VKEPEKRKTKSKNI